MVEPVSQDVKYQSWLFSKKELSCSAGRGKHLLSECKGPGQRGGSAQAITGVDETQPIGDVCFKTQSAFSSHAQAESEQQSKIVTPPKVRDALPGAT